MMIPSSVTSIGDSAFRNCTGLTAITVDASNPNYSSDDFGVLYDKNKMDLILYPIGNERTAFTIPASVTRIGASAFYVCTGLTSVTIGNSVETIEGWAFSGCTGLTSVTIPDSVTSIGSSAFAYCTGLTSVTIGNSVTSIDGAFSNCTGLTSVTIPASVTSIGDDAFRGCRGLTSVTIPNSVTSIGDWAFYNCTGLTSVTIPDSVTSISYGAFYNCTGLTSVTIPDSVTSIGDYAFYQCFGLTSVTIPASVTSIGYNAFTRCSDDLTIIGYVGSCAQTYANDYGIPFIPIDDAPYVVLHCPLETSTASFEAYGVANPNQTVSVYDGETLLGTAKVDVNGRWKGSFTLNEPVDLSSHTITAKMTVGDKTVTDSKTLVYDTNAVYPVAFTLTHSGKTIDCLNARVFNLSVIPSKPMTFNVTLNRSVTNLWVTSTKGSEVKKIKANYDNATGTWTAEGWFDPANHNYVPGTLGLEVNDGTALPFEAARINYLIDPSGYVYEAVKSNRVEGATATVYYKLGESALVWDANRYEQDNPQITDSLGAYHWDVTEGDWQVKVEKDGYETAYSDWMTVQPEWTEVAIPIVCKAAPTVEKIEKDGDGYKLTFDRYMDLTTVNNTNIQFTNGGSSVNGAVTPLDKEVSGTDSSVYYARTFMLKPAAAITDITVKNVKSYAGTVMAGEFKKTLETPPAQPKVTKVELDDVTMNYKDSVTLKPTVTADEGAEYTVKYKSSNPNVVKVNEETGEATGAKRGSATITVTVTDTTGHTVTDTCKVTVKYTVLQWIIIILLFGWLWY